jgi:hypothetical protein
MKPPGQLGDGERKIPIAEGSRKNMGATLSHALTRIRRDEGVDPDRYPPVAFDIEYDTRRTMIGAEITARETADLILPAIRSTPALAANPGGRWAMRLLVTLLIALGIAATTFGWLTYQEMHRVNELRSVVLDQYQYLGRAIQSHPKVNIQREGSDFIIHFDNELNKDNLFDATIRLPHNIPLKEIERLDQN